MPKSMLKDALDGKIAATKTALTRVRSNTGQETDTDLEIYSSLKPEDFTAIAERYGPDNVLRYIRKMETARMTRKEG